MKSAELQACDFGDDIPCELRTPSGREFQIRMWKLLSERVLLSERGAPKNPLIELKRQRGGFDVSCGGLRGVLSDTLATHHGCERLPWWQSVFTSSDWTRRNAVLYENGDGNQRAIARIEWVAEPYHLSDGVETTTEALLHLAGDTSPYEIQHSWVRYRFTLGQDLGYRVFNAQGREIIASTRGDRLLRISGLDERMPAILVMLLYITWAKWRREP